MKVTFIAHAGICIEENGVMILVDPWFTSSNVNMPILEGLLSHRTIDFQTPLGNAHASQYAHASGIFVSHLHTHHAPKHDIFSLLTLRAPQMTTFGHPHLQSENELKLKTLLTDMSAYVALHSFKDNDTFELGPFVIRARTHTVPGHVAWHIKSATGSVLHIADPAANKDSDRVSLDAVWNSFVEYRPDILFLNAGGNTLRIEHNGEPSFKENGCISPAQAALLARKLEPRVISLIGCYNKSIWNGTNEYMRPAPNIEDEMYWCMQWVAPHVRCVFARPGHRYLIRESAVQDSDTYIS